MTSMTFMYAYHCSFYMIDSPSNGHTGTVKILANNVELESNTKIRTAMIHNVHLRQDKEVKACDMGKWHCKSSAKSHK